jgi:HAD superfamily hydrolase (TIGR01484 family)
MLWTASLFCAQILALLISHAMRYFALATDYDGTLATDGQVDQSTLSALERWRQSGRNLILITGRQLDELRRVFEAIALFDWVVAENGALLYHPATQTETPLGEPPPDLFIEQLRDRINQKEQQWSQHPSGEFDQLLHDNRTESVFVGRVIVATWEPHGATATEVIQEMGLDHQVILNKGAVMILPMGIDKTTGLKAVLAELDLSPEQTVGVGDAENDCGFLKQCGYAVAVANALPSVKQQVNWVTTGSRGAGVVELIDQILGAEN